MIKALRKQASAIKLSIQALTNERRRYATGHQAWLQGVRPDVIHDGEVEGVGFGWAETDHKEYLRYCEAIGEMEDMLEALEEVK